MALKRTTPRPAGFMKPFSPKSVETKVPQGPVTRGVFPRYVAVGNSKRKPDERRDLFDGRVFGEFADGELIGVEIKG